MTALPEHNEKFGKILERTAVDDGDDTIQISVIEQNGERNLEIRGIWFDKNDTPRFGKGKRIKISQAEEVLLIAQAYLEKYGDV